MGKKEFCKGCCYCRTCKKNLKVCCYLQNRHKINKYSSKYILKN